MNKNTLIGLLVIGGILFGFSAWNSSKVEEPNAESARKQANMDSIDRANAPVVSAQEQIQTQAMADSLALVREAQVLGSLASTAQGTEEFFTLENELALYTFSNKGGKIARVELKDYKRQNPKNEGENVVLFSNEGNNFGFDVYAPERLSTAQLFFELHTHSKNSVTYRLRADSLSYIDYVYTIAENDYMMDFSADFSHFRSYMLATQPAIELQWSVASPKEEKGFTNENNYTTVAYKVPGDDDNIEELVQSKGVQSESIPTKVQWVAFKQQFFSSIIVGDFASADVGYATYEPTADYIKDFHAKFTLPYSPTQDTYNFDFYFGPNKFSTLEAYGEKYQFQELVPLGWGIFGWVNELIVIPVFDFLSGFISNYGIIILLLTLFIKIIILPLTYKSYMSMAKMRLLGPQIKEIAERYPKREDAMKKQQATMALYKSAGVSPMGGCIPMLIQFPVLIAMFRFFPASIELRGESFLWATDLSSYDGIDLPFSIPFYGDHVSLFTLLMAVSLFVMQKINMKQQSAMQSNSMPGMQFMMLYIMPLMLLFMFNDFASGLTYYYFLSNVITIGQTYAFRSFVSDAKLHAKMQDNAKKPVKKSKWQARLEEMQRQQQQQQQQRRK
ncbi:MAG: membrane protein insertase YidC [Rikenellaceae bacterium]